MKKIFLIAFVVLGTISCSQNEDDLSITEIYVGTWELKGAGTVYTTGKIEYNETIESDEKQIIEFREDGTCTIVWYNDSNPNGDFIKGTYDIVGGLFILEYVDEDHEQISEGFRILELTNDVFEWVFIEYHQLDAPLDYAYLRYEKVN